MCACVCYFSALILPLSVEPLLVHGEAEKLFHPSNRASDSPKQLVAVEPHTLGKEAPVAPVAALPASLSPPVLQVALSAGVAHHKSNTVAPL